MSDSGILGLVEMSERIVDNLARMFPINDMVHGLHVLQTHLYVLGVETLRMTRQDQGGPYGILF